MSEKKQIWVWVAYIGFALTLMLFLLMICLFFLGVSTPQITAFMEQRHIATVASFSNVKQNFADEIEHLVVTTEKIQTAAMERKAEHDRIVAEKKAEQLAIEKARAEAEAEAAAALLAMSQAKIFASDVFLSTKGEHDLVYYNQTEEPWKDEEYAMGNLMGPYGCGPTVLSMVLSTFLQQDILPTDMAEWSYANGYFAQNSGSHHELIPAAAEAFGLGVKSLLYPTQEELILEIEQGNLVVVLMGAGTFSSAGHFIVLRDITEDGMVLVGDSQSLGYSQAPWDPQLILGEAKYYAGAGGPFWAISPP
ncbi:MAG: C39 family peptidase [Bacillota bacterium]